MTVLVRIALRSGVAPEVGSLFTIVPATAVTLTVALARGHWDFASAWPFVFAGLLAPGISQILFTFARARCRGLAHVGDRRDGTALRRRDGARVPRRAARRRSRPRCRRSSSPAASSSRAIARGPSTSSASGSFTRSCGTVAFATRDTYVRWLVTDVTDVDPVLAASVAMLAGTSVALAFVSLETRLGDSCGCGVLRSGRALLRVVVRLPVRGVRSGPRVGRLAHRRN